MRKNTQALCTALEAKIKAAYEESVTVTEAERLAGEFLHAQMVINNELSVASLDARMRKAGLKAVRAAVYLEKARAGDKKPSDVLLQAECDVDELVAGEQKGFDEAEVEAEALHNFLRIFEAAHVYFRQMSRSTG